MSQRSFTDLGPRVVTALILFLAVCALLFLAPGWVVAIVAAVASGIAMWEFERMAFAKAHPVSTTLAIIICAMLPLLALGGGSTLAGGIGGAFVLVALVSLIRATDMEQAFYKIAYRGWASAYFGGLFACLVLLLQEPGGAALVLFLVVVVAFADMGAYFTGHVCGRTKLAKKVSPGKTWEGLFGGMAAAAIIGGFYGLLPYQDAGISQGVLMGVVLAVVSVIGDLLESALKRAKGVKDSSRLLPGHGGLWDRVDGLLPAAGAMLLLRGLM